MSRDYGDMFDSHDRHRASRRTNAGYLADILWRYVQPGSVIDLGCGLGFFLAACAARGAEVRGVDGDWVGPLDTEIPREAYTLADLNRPFAADRRYDLAASIEVAEHLDPARSEPFADELCALSDVVLFSAGIPGQGGVGHINLRFQEEWAEIFAARGYGCFDPIRRRMAAHSDGFLWLRQNPLLFVRDGVAVSPLLEEHRIAPRAATMVSKELHQRRLNALRRKLQSARKTRAGDPDAG